VILTGDDEQLHERVTARPDSVAPLRKAVVRFAAGNGASAPQRDDIALAVTEALANAVLHAYVGHDRPGVVAVDAWMRERSLEVVVCDEGNGMLPRTDSPGMGIGLTLIDRIAEQFRLEDVGPGVRVRMTFAIGAR
jgi:serine/threonine-protein kinase RsbW/stage II sporulation protein AB (anti-sigma F factor)